MASTNCELELLSPIITSRPVLPHPFGPGTLHSCGSGAAIARIRRLTPAFRRMLARGGELDAALDGLWGLMLQADSRKCPP